MKPKPAADPGSPLDHQPFPGTNRHATPRTSGLDSTMLSVCDVCKTFAAGPGRDELDVLRDIGFEVSNGELVSIIGPSGCGKTTLLRILHGLEPATSGAVFVSGKRVERPSPLSAIVFQHFNLF